MDDVVYEVATKDDAQCISNLFEEGYSGKYHIPHSPEVIEQNISEQIEIFTVAKQCGQIIGCGSVKINKEHNGGELGKTVVSSRAKGVGVGANLVRKSLDRAKEIGIDMVYGRARNAAIYRVSRSIAELTGYLPGTHFIGQRELHLFFIRPFDQGKAKHVAPKRQTIYRLFWMKNVRERIGLESDIGDYPDDIFSPWGMGKTMQIQGSYYAADKSFTITSMSQLGQIPEHYQAVVLIDKVEHIHHLQELGYSITAYLPCWFEKEGKRYDCVLLSKPLRPYVEHCNKFSKHVSEIQSAIGGGDAFVD